MIKNITMAAIGAIFLTGCSWLDNWPPGNSGAERSSVRVVDNGSGSYNVEQGRALPPPYVTQEQTAEQRSADQDYADKSEQNRAAALDLTPLHQMERTPSAMPVEERLSILEENVMQIQSMMMEMQPAMQRFAGLEDSLQRLLHDMEAATSAKGSGQNHIPADRQASMHNEGVPQNLLRNDNATQPAVTKPQKKMAAPKGYINQLRIGEHPGKTRIVMDATADLDFDTYNENQGKVLIIDLPFGGWQAAESMRAKNSPLIEGYEAQPDGNGGTRVFLSLKKDVKVVWAEALAPVGDQGHRIVIDLASI